MGSGEKVDEERKNPEREDERHDPFKNSGLLAMAVEGKYCEYNCEDNCE